MQYRTLSPIAHDGQKFFAGELIDLTDAQATPLLKSKFVEPAHKPFGKRVVMPYASATTEEPVVNRAEIDPLRLGSADLLLPPTKPL